MLRAPEDGSQDSHSHYYCPHLPTMQECQRAYMMWTVKTAPESLGAWFSFGQSPVPSVTLSFPPPTHDNLFGA